MFLFVGFLIGLNLMTRVALGETREIQARGHARGGKARVTPGEAFRIALRGGMFLLVPMALGQLLDMAFGSTITELFAA